MHRYIFNESYVRNNNRYCGSHHISVWKVNPSNFSKYGSSALETICGSEINSSIQVEIQGGQGLVEFRTAATIFPYTYTGFLASVEFVQLVQNRTLFLPTSTTPESYSSTSQFVESLSTNISYSEDGLLTQSRPTFSVLPNPSMLPKFPPDKLAVSIANYDNDNFAEMDFEEPNHYQENEHGKIFTVLVSNVFTFCSSKNFNNCC